MTELLIEILAALMLGAAWIGANVAVLVMATLW